MSLKVWSYLEVLTSTDLNGNMAELDSIVPIGTILPFYDYNGALSFDTNKFAYCDGSTKTITGIGSQTLPDLSNRYLVGFGTEGGTDIDSAAWATAAVGNASHQANLEHEHTYYYAYDHTHTFDTQGALGGTTAATLYFDIGTGTRHHHMGTTDGSSTGTATTSTTGGGLSTTQTIQPRSIRVRFIMRIA